jgi:hypothetical protein
MDPAGHLLGDPATLRLPPCAEHPEECVFAITGQAARDAALRASGTTGLDASTEFRWSDRHGRYTWTVKMWPPGTNPNAGVAPPEGARFAILDGNTGHVLEAGLWTKPSQVRE